MWVRKTNNLHTINININTIGDFGLFFSASLCCFVFHTYIYIYTCIYTYKTSLCFFSFSSIFYICVLFTPVKHWANIIIMYGVCVCFSFLISITFLCIRMGFIHITHTLSVCWAQREKNYIRCVTYEGELWKHRFIWFDIITFVIVWNEKKETTNN